MFLPPYQLFLRIIFCCPFLFCLNIAENENAILGLKAPYFCLGIFRKLNTVHSNSVKPFLFLCYVFFPRVSNAQDSFVIIIYWWQMFYSWTSLLYIYLYCIFIESKIKNFQLPFIHSFSPSFYHLLVIIILHVRVLVLVSYFHIEKLGSISGVEPEGGWIQICGVPWAVEKVWGVMGGDWTFRTFVLVVVLLDPTHVGVEGPAVSWSQAS